MIPTTLLTLGLGLASAGPVVAPAPVPAPVGPAAAAMPWAASPILPPALALPLPWPALLFEGGRFAEPEAPRAPVPAVGAERPAASGAADAYRRLLDRFGPRVEGLSPESRQALWDEAFAHPVAGLDDPAKLQRYDPTGIIGFCFGRAMAVHLLARRLGLAESSIAKLFVVGDLRSGPDPEWRFHVATLVRGADGRWYAIDPILGEPVEAREWVARVRGIWDREGKAKFYRVPAAAVLPDITTVPETPEKESGERLIELRFEPAGRAGFEPRPELGASTYELSAAETDRHFKSALSPAAAFDFSGIAINGEPIGYNGYFEALLASLESETTKPEEPRRALSPQAAAPGPLAKARGGRGRSVAAEGAPLGLRIGRLSRPR